MRDNAGAALRPQLERSPALVGRSRAPLMLADAVAVLAAAASLFGLLADGAYADPAGVAAMLRGYDLVTLVLAVPILALTQIHARRGSDRAQLTSMGVLAYLTYTYAIYLFGTAFNDLFLLHVAVFTGSLLALVLGVSTRDAPAIAAMFTRPTPRRFVAAVLGLLSAGLGAMWVYHAVRFTVTGALPPGSALVEPEDLVHLSMALDLALLVPAYAVGCVLLWRGVPAGYMLASVLLISGTLHQVSYMVALPFQTAAGIPGAVAFDPAEPVIAMLFVVATAALLAGAGRRHGTSAELG